MTDNPLQNIVEAMGDAAQTQRANYHVTLGRLIEVLADVGNPEMPVFFADGGSPGRPRSYRGYYGDLAFGTTEEPTTTADLLDVAQNALGREFTGYKGGDFMMDEQTPLWRAEWSHLGDPILTVTVERGHVLLTCGEE